MKVIMLSLVLLTSMLQAKKPTLELGIGVFGFSYPTYLGSSKQKLLVLPQPYIQYRGDLFQVDNEGIKKSLFDVDGLNLDVSIGASLSVDSKNSKLREGMEDLDFVFEMGPRLSYEIYQEANNKLFFKLPLRATLSTNFEDDISYRGLFTAPELKIVNQVKKRKLSFSSGVVFASEDYYDYFYGVDKEYETPQRASYEGKGGYGGWRNRVGFSDQKGSWVYDAYVVHYLLKGVSFEDSPLMQQKNGLFIQMSLSYIFYTCK